MNISDSQRRAGTEEKDTSPCKVLRLLQRKPETRRSLTGYILADLDRQPFLDFLFCQPCLNTCFDIHKKAFIITPTHERMNMPCGAGYKPADCVQQASIVRCNLETILSAAKSNKIHRPCAHAVTIPVVKTTSTLLFPLITY